MITTERFSQAERKAIKFDRESLLGGIIRGILAAARESFVLDQDAFALSRIDIKTGPNHHRDRV